MRCFYLLCLLYVCDCNEYRRHDDNGVGINSYRSVGGRGSDRQNFKRDEQDYSMGHDEERSDKRYSVNDGHEIKDKSEYSERNYNSHYNKNCEKYGVSYYGYTNKNKDERDAEYDERNDKKYDEVNKRCRYIGPLYDSRKLDKYQYRHNDFTNDYERVYRNRYERNYGNDNCDQLNDGKKEDIIRPCSFNDWECIRKYLADNSGCEPAYGPIPDPMLIPEDKFFIPIVNLTITHTNLKVTGFASAKISEFYLNKETGNLVIAIDVVKLNQTSPKSFFTYQRTSKEPIVLSDFTIVQYSGATFTAVLPYYPKLRLDKAEIHADVDDSTPTYMIGPGIFNSTDPDVVTAFAQFNLNIPSVIQEAFVFQSYLLIANYIQKSICDFGIDVCGNYLRFLRTKGFVISPNNDIENV